MKIYNEPREIALERVENGDVTACVVGAGTIGLPLATFLANKNFSVACYDKSSERVKQINGGQVVFEYHEELKRALEREKISASTDPAVMRSAELIFVCVPTPLTHDKAMDISILFDVGENIGRNISAGSMVIFESSVAIGTTAQVRAKIEQISGLKCGVDFGVAYCPERYNPGLPKEIHPEIRYSEGDSFHEQHRFDQIGRVVGGADKKSLDLAKAVYSTIIKAKIKTVSSIEAAEATKLLENIFRDVNIALVNELAKVFSEFNLDTFEVIEAAKSKPFAFLPHYPGCGVGGECIPVDTHYLIKQAEDMGIETSLMNAARSVNDSMPQYTVSLLERALKKKGRGIQGSNINILGAAYKKNINDTRLSPAFVIAQMLQDMGANVKICDPLVHESRLNGHESVSLPDIFDRADAIILATDHDVFKSLDFSKSGSMRTKIIIDGRNFFVRDALEKNGFTYRCVGKS